MLDDAAASLEPGSPMSPDEQHHGLAPAPRPTTAAAAQPGMTASTKMADVRGYSFRDAGTMLRQLERIAAGGSASHDQGRWHERSNGSAAAAAATAFGSPQACHAPGYDQHGGDTVSTSARLPAGASAVPLGTWSPRPKRRREGYITDAAAGLTSAAPALHDLTAAYQPAAQRRAAPDASGSRPSPMAGRQTAADLFARAADQATPAPMHPGVADLTFSPLALGSSGRGRTAQAAVTPAQRRSGRLAKLARRAVACLGIGRAPRRSPVTPAVRRVSGGHVPPAGTALQPVQPAGVHTEVSPDGCRIPAAMYQRVAAHGPLAAAAASASWAATPAAAASRGADAATSPDAMQQTPATAAATPRPHVELPARTPRSCTPAAALAAETARKRAAAARRGRPKPHMPRSGGSAGRRSSGSKKVRARPGELTRAAHQAVSARMAPSSLRRQPSGTRQIAPAARPLQASISPHGAPMSYAAMPVPPSPLPFSLPTTPLRVKYAGRAPGPAHGGSTRNRNRKTVRPSRRHTGQDSAEAALVTELIPASSAPAAAKPAATVLPQRPPTLWQPPATRRSHEAAAAIALLGVPSAAGAQQGVPVARPAGMLSAAAMRSRLLQRQPLADIALPPAAGKEQAASTDPSQAGAAVGLLQPSSGASVAALEAVASSMPPEVLPVAALPAPTGPLLAQISSNNARCGLPVEADVKGQRALARKHLQWLAADAFDNSENEPSVSGSPLKGDGVRRTGVKAKLPLDMAQTPPIKRRQFAAHRAHAVGMQPASATLRMR